MSRLTFLVNYVPCRSISLSVPCEGKRNFRKFMIINKRGSRLHKKQQANNPNPELPIDKRGVRDVGYMLDKRFETVPEMIPDIIVPDLTDCKFKPYVSYRAADVVQSEFTAQQLFDAIYSEKIVKDYKSGSLDEDGNPLKPSDDEKLTPEEAVNKARKTGSDIF